MKQKLINVIAISALIAASACAGYEALDVLRKEISKDWRFE